MAEEKKPEHSDVRRGKGQAVIAPGAIVITTDQVKLKAAVEKCMAETGKVTIKFQEVSITQLGQIVDLENIVN